MAKGRKTLSQNQKIEKIWKNLPPPGGLEPPTFRLTAERASQLRHGGLLTINPKIILLIFRKFNHSNSHTFSKSNLTKLKILSIIWIWAKNFKIGILFQSS